MDTAPVPSFTHLLLTRFNVRNVGATHNDLEWLAHRFDLFMRFCHPSVMAQSCHDFEWILFLDSETPEPWRAKLESLRREGRITLSYLQGFDLAQMRQVCLGRVRSGSTHLLTTSLDNDDAIARGFIAAVQSCFRTQPFEILNFCNGYRLSLARNRLYRCQLKANPFVSLVERLDRAVTVMACLPHWSIPRRFAAVRDVDTRPLWLQMIHDRNLEPTGVWGWPRVPLSDLGEFSLDPSPWNGVPERGGFRLENLFHRVERLVVNRLGAETRSRLRQLVRVVQRTL